MHTATQVRFTIFSFCAAILATALTGHAATAPAFEWITLQANASSADALNIIISSEGYTSSQKDLFLSDAQIVMSAFVNKDPWKTYISHLNFYAGWVVSNQAGVSILNGATVDTAFKAVLDPSSEAGDLDYATVYAYETAVPVSGQHIFIINTTDYTNGFAMGGVYAVFCRDGSTSNNTMVGGALHETGHSIAYLSDEHLGGGLMYPGKNVTTDLNNIPWSVWLDTGVSLPTPDTYAQPYTLYAYTRVGAFLGAYIATAYRPTYSSIMIDGGGGGGEYGPVNREAIILAIYAKTGPMISITPTASSVKILFGQQQVFTPVKWSAPSTITTKWYVDDTLYASTDTLTVKYADLTIGQHSLKCVVKDETTWVRNDPQKLTEDTTTWSLLIGDVPQITLQPSSLTVVAGQSASFSVTVSGNNLTYQWRKGGSAIPGATAATYSIGSTATSDSASYDCIISNSYGSATSSSVSLTVNPASSSSTGGGGALSDTFLASLLVAVGARLLTKRDVK